MENLLWIERLCPSAPGPNSCVDALTPGEAIFGCGFSKEVIKMN